MKQLTKAQFLNVLQDRIDESGNQQAFAKANNISAAYVSDVLNHRREPGEKILNALNATAVTNYVIDNEKETNEERDTHLDFTRPLRQHGQHQAGRNRRIQQLPERAKGRKR